MANSPPRKHFKALPVDQWDRLHEMSISGMAKGMQMLPIVLLSVSRCPLLIQLVRLATSSPTTYSTAIGLTLSIHRHLRARSMTAAGVPKRYNMYSIELIMGTISDRSFPVLLSDKWLYRCWAVGPSLRACPQT